MGHNSKTIHFSIDDCIDAFKSITQKSFGLFESTTPWRQTMLGELQRLHMKYGLTATLFCMQQGKNFDILDCTERFSPVFKESRHWLKFGFHSIASDTSFSKTSGKEALKHYEKITSKLMKITGGDASIDDVLRLHYFAGNEDVLHALKESRVKPLRGVLGPDDDRNAYNLDESESLFLRREGCLSKNGIDYYTTDLRLENIHEIAPKIYDLAKQDRHIEIFTHEWAFKRECRKLYTICEMAQKMGYVWEFPHKETGGKYTADA